MEVATAILGAPALFLSGVECFARIQLGRQFGKDYESSVITLNSLRLRYLRWGQAIGLDQEVDEPQAPFQIPNATLEENIQAKYEMGCILEIIEEAENLAKRYTGNPKVKLEDLVVGEEDAIVEIPVKKILEFLTKKFKTRQKNVSWIKKTKWALYRKGDFDSMIKKVTEHVTNLVELFPAAKERQATAIAAEVAEVQDGVELNILRDAAVITDPMLQDAVERANQGSGHEFRNNILDDCDNVVYGNVNESGSGGREISSTYIGNKATKSKNIIYGNKTTHGPAK